MVCKLIICFRAAICFRLESKHCLLVKTAVRKGSARKYLKTWWEGKSKLFTTDSMFLYCVLMNKLTSVLNFWSQKKKLCKVVLSTSTYLLIFSANFVTFVNGYNVKILTWLCCLRRFIHLSKYIYIYVVITRVTYLY